MRADPTDQPQVALALQVPLSRQRLLITLVNTYLGVFKERNPYRSFSFRAPFCRMKLSTTDRRVVGAATRKGIRCDTEPIILIRIQKT